MAAAPHLFDDRPIASPELALVDADLAEQLRAELASTETFRPREVARPAYLSLVFDVADDEPAPAEQHVDELDEAAVDVAPAYVVLVDDEHVEDVALFDEEPHEEAQDRPVLPELVEAVDELPDYIVADSEQVVEVVPEDAMPTDEVVVELAEPADEPPVPALVEPAAAELPDYVVAAPEPVADDDVPEYIAPADEAVVDEVTGYVPEGIELPLLPSPDHQADELPEYIVRADEVALDVVPEYVVLPGAVRVDDDLVPADGDEAVDQSSDYPVLPDLDERSDALEETEAALRKIRENLVVPATAERKRRVRRRFTVGAGLCAFTALAVYAAELELGVAHAPGWLSF